VSTATANSPLLSALELPETPRWHAGRIWLTDIRAGRVFSVSPDGDARMEAELDEPCSGLSFLPDGRAVVTLMASRRIIDLEGGLHADLVDIGGRYLNDMIIGADGAGYVDCISSGIAWGELQQLDDGGRRFDFGIDYSAAPATLDAIALVREDGTAEIVADDLLGPNGLALAEDGTQLYVAEWRANRITVFDVADDGSLGNRRVFAETGTRSPDGICLDAAGGVWFGAHTTSECVRIVEGGTVTDVVQPAAGNRVTACVLGGDDRRTLYMTTDRKPEPTSGHLEAVRVADPGAGRP
jgi:sugar lactone lactonase YvrE